MARITDIEIENVRCFGEQQSARTSRITLLVGEHGTGKTTFLGCYGTLAKLAPLYDLAEVNHFDDLGMGSFDSIVRRGKTEFKIGGKFADHCHDRLALSFRRDGQQPIDREMDLLFRGANGLTRRVRIASQDSSSTPLQLETPDFSFHFLPGEVSFRSISTWLSRYVRNGYLPFGGNLGVFRQNARNREGATRDAAFLRLASLLGRELPFPDPSALRTEALQPALPARQREYASTPDHLVDDDARLFAFLGDMGRVLGLWEGVRVEGTPSASGVQVLVDAPNGRFNLMDVGYGTHSLLVTLSAIHKSAPETVLLLQQPEAHLHPRAQAELAQWMAESGRSFMIETHSDHFVDRLRICVMKELLAPEDLSILYFEPRSTGSLSRIHNISVDTLGNLDHEPEGYRSFFLQEAKSLLGFA